MFGKGEYAFSQGIKDKLKVEVIERALLFAGFAESTGDDKISDEEIKLIRLDDDTTPFLNLRYKNKAVWQITFKGMNLKTFYNNVADMAYDRDYDVFIDSASGKLLKITCFYDTPLPNECPQLSAKSAEEQLSNVGEQYIEIPDDIPAISFGEALEKCPESHYKAKEVVGQYILYSDGIRKPKPMWIISLCGIPPRPNPTHPRYKALDIPLYQRNRIRELINATTGSIVMTSTSPAVRRLPEDSIVTKTIRIRNKND